MSKVNVSAIEKTDSKMIQATVVSVSDKKAVINADGKLSVATVTFSCLVQPEPEDLVICCGDESGNCFILGIIERQGPQNLTLAFPGNAKLMSDKGTLNLSSRKSLTITSQENLNCFSQKSVHKSKDALFDFDEITARGTIFQGNFNTVRLISQTVMTSARYVIQQAINYIRETEKADQIKAGQLLRKVKGLFSMSSKTTIMISEKDTKIDGERIHMG